MRRMACVLLTLPLGCFADAGDPDTSSASGTSAGTDSANTSESTTATTSTSDTNTTTGPTTDSTTDSDSDTTTGPTTDSTTDPTTDSTTDTATTGQPGCEGTCLPAPDGWLGPVTLFEGALGDSVPACLGAFGADGPGGFGELDEGTPSCECTCSDATGITCAGKVTLVGHPAGAFFCNTIDPPTWDLTQGSCTAIFANTHRWRTSAIQPSGGSCTAQDNHTIPEPTWGLKTASCEATVDSTGCADAEWCVPEPTAPFSRQCVYQGGDATCPDGYPNKLVRFDGFEDARSCSSCGCGTVEADCDTKVTLTDNCNIFIDVATPDMCTGDSAPTHATASTTPNGTCPPSGGELQGQVSTTGAVTFCCV